MSKLHIPLKFQRSGKTAANRIALAAMTNQQSHDDGSLSEAELAWLIKRGEGGFGIVTTCAAHVHPRGKGWKGALGVDHEGLLPGLQRLATGLRKTGALSMVQLFHGGARAPASLIGEQPLSASDGWLPGDAETTPPAVAATEEDLQCVIRSFAEAARRTEQAGFDGIELHGAHGYLLAQFLSPLSNRRNDGWGGSLDKRMRLLREVLAAVKSHVSADFLVGVRLSPRIFPNQPREVTLESYAVARQLIADGVDFLHYSLWDFRATLEPTSDGDPALSLLRMATDTIHGACPLFVAGKINSATDAMEAVEMGTTVVALGRTAIAYPDWPNRVAANPAFTPPAPPYPAKQLADAAVSPAFLDYLSRRPGFVSE